MTKEEFLKELNKNLKGLSRKERQEELIYYENLDNYNDLDSIQIANDIYKKRNIKIVLTKNIKFLDAINILIVNLKSKDKEKLKKLLLFFLYIFLFIIVIKVPFIYVRNMITDLLNDTFQNQTNYAIWALFIEFIYAITACLISISMIKKKALELEKDTK